MLIDYDNNGFEKLEDFSYVFKRDVFRRKNLYYKYIPKCIECGQPFFMRVSYPTKFCSKLCSSNSKYTRNKISASLTGHVRSKEECQKISDRVSKGDVVSKNLPLYNTYYKYLILIEDVKDNKGFLSVKCSVCGEWFIPKRTKVDQRVQYIKGNIDRENKFYCSEECKHSCIIFNKHKYPKGFNPRQSRNTIKIPESQLRTWSKEVMIIADYTCEICNNPAKHSHHIQPKKLEPGLALDPYNGIALCEKCHYKYGHNDECSSIKLANVRCNKISKKH